MRLAPRSLSGRLLAISALTTIVALIFASIGIGRVLERFVIHGLDQQLDAEVAMLTRALRPDGALDAALVVDLPVFAQPGRGWGWRVESPRGRWAGGDAIDIRPPPRLLPAPEDRRALGFADMIPGEGLTAAGEPIHVRETIVPKSGGDAVIVAAGPRRLATAPLREAMLPLLASLAILGVVLAAATIVQLRVGLRPLRALRMTVADIRAGRARHIPADQPSEIAPLAAELNALIDQNEAQLEQARRHVANLAHGLKTPLAALALRLAEGNHDPDNGLRAMVADIDRRIRHHLGRARAAAPGGRLRSATMLAETVAGLVAVMRGVHAERAIGVAVDVARDLTVAADPQDLDEMLGNLLDNAWRHARSEVTITAERIGATVDLTIEDDGPGLTGEAIAEALLPGRRLDERGDGHGFGLPITQELAELNGGRLTLRIASWGAGLRAVLSLPAGAALPGQDGGHKS